MASECPLSAKSDRSIGPLIADLTGRLRPEADIRLCTHLIRWDQTLQFFEPILNSDKLLVERSTV